MTFLGSERVVETLDKLHADADAADRDFTAGMLAHFAESGETMEEAVGNLIAEEHAD